jgi:uncharacterized protein with FMN-binding domain
VKKSVVRYSASVSAAALFAMLSIGGTAFASDHDEEEEEEEEEDEYEVVLDICNSPSDFDEAVIEEVKNSPAVEKAKSAYKKAEKAFGIAVKSEATALVKLNKAKFKNGKGHAVQLAKAQSSYDAAVLKTASTLATYNTKLSVYTNLVESTESSIRSRFNADCGIVDPTPTDTTVPVDPTPTDTTVPVDPTVPVEPVVLAAPTGLTADTSTSLNTGAFRLKWSAVTGATSYKIFRDGVQIGTSNTTNFTPASATLSSVKSYHVVATDGTVDSPASASISASPYQGTSVVDKKGLKIYGYIQVSIAVTDQRITGCWATYPTSSDSGPINRSAIPKFCTAAINAQSATISNVSGASATWTAFKSSLQAALTQAGI